MQTFSKQDKLKTGMLIAISVLFGSLLFGQVLNFGPVLTELSTVVGTLLAIRKVGPKTIGITCTFSKIKKLGQNTGSKESINEDCKMGKWCRKHDQ